jgi:tungstate transport system substrate-binding protein
MKPTIHFPKAALRAEPGFMIRKFALVLLVCIIPAQAQERLRIATTTSVQDTGLMPYLLPDFEKKHGCKVDLIAVGSGQALKLASNGDVDMVFVHDPDAESRFVNSGSGFDRTTFMFNDFVILGPASDPARIKGMKDAANAFKKIQQSGSVFVSRGDQSGTNQKEKAIWQKAGIKPSGLWYLEIGQGMGAVLTMTEEKHGYTLCDRSTFLARMNQLKLQVLTEGDPDLVNYYSAIQVNPAKFPSVKAELSHEMIHWICSKETQKRIGEFAVGGRTLFKPACKTGK